MSAGGADQTTARQALYEVQRYLADEIAPMMVVDAANTMLRMPPKYGAAAIRQWVDSQLAAPDQAVTVAGYLFHAFTKIYQLTELELIPPGEMDRYLADLSKIVVELCPEREQAELLDKLTRIGEVRTTLSEPLKLLNREIGNIVQEQQYARALEEQQQEPPAPGAVAAPSRRLALMLGRLDERAGAAGDADSRQDLVAPLVTEAAVEAQDPEQLQQTLDALRDKGIEPAFDKLFRTLGRSVPGWAIDADGNGDPEVPLGRALQAMHRLIALAGSSEEGADRLGKMVYAAIEQFNDGHLAQAVAMFDVAQRLLDEEKVDAEVTDAIRLRAQESLSMGALRKFASVPAKYGLLRKVLRFFPALRPESLLVRLDGEPKREQRKLLLSLIEVHGPPCRPMLLARLGGYRTGDLMDPNGFYSRNVVFLLRRVPRGPEGDQLEELELLSEFSRPGRPFMVTKEAVGALANLSLPQAERRLIDRLTGFEHEALSLSSPYTADELMEMLDRICAALIRLGTAPALEAVVDHAFRKESQLGVVASRLVYLAGVDLAEHRSLLDRLVQALRQMLPAKILGVVLGRKEQDAAYLIRALSGTDDPSVRKLFEEVVERYPGEEFAEQAEEALARLQKEPEHAGKRGVELSGDLELFGLPTLLQSLADTQATGRLGILDGNGRERAAVFFGEGGIVHCGVGRLRGLDAVCHLFERPQPGTFRFDKAPPDDPALAGKATLAVMPAVLEAVRRHDEFQEDRALVPDGTSMKPTGTPATLPEEESDAEFVEAVWREASRGTAPETCEGTLGGDAYRVRRLYAHWLTQGALALRPSV